MRSNFLEEGLHNLFLPVRILESGAGHPQATSVPGGHTMSISTESRWVQASCSINALPPLKRKGQPERARASSRESARMAFSISVGSLTLFMRQDSRIHSRLRLFGSIIALSIVSVDQFLLSCHGGRHSGAWSFCRCGTSGRRSQR